MNVGIYIYDQAEVLDFAGPFEVFSTASRVADGEAPFNAFLVAENEGPVVARAGFKVAPHCTFKNHPSFDVLIIVGGVHTGELAKPNVMEWIASQAAKATVVATVCTGIFLLAKACPQLTGKVTTHWEDIDDLRSMFSHLDVVEGVRWVDEGKVVSSGGISSGIDMCLHLVAKLHSTDLADKTARQMEYVWTKSK
ncbi:DJ-1/PfpI family protein [Marinimicrobium sp. ABcell2]|uniref:DJ-1/PfpI family protein n=1 Tax=Marinimicrobium sp. ABcell2 TaxID=3069751 RepID=UPI0027B27C90|nr:DJ-1/PfpI family protein [Marinimicrobium sp. ABcell2]MDQ2078399.1 DJ-1/PfpI family protein [Marinimicrobium sp. ABcell2]